MRRAALLAVALAGCAHRFPLASTDPLHALAGVTVEFGSAAAPEGTTIRWEFGDGAVAVGATARHAFSRAGRFTVTEVVVDADGERRAGVPVEVERRSPLMAVPPQAEAAMVFDRLFERSDAYWSFLSRAFTPSVAESVQARARELLGFDPMKAESLRAAGIALDEGAAWVGFAEEPQARYLLVGTVDDAATEAAIAALFVRRGATITEGPEGFRSAQLPGSASDVLFRHDRGYLIVRIPGDAPEPPLALGDFARAPDRGLADVPTVQKLRAELGDGDVLVYRARSALVGPESSAHPDALPAHIQALVAQLRVGADAVEGDALLAVDAAGLPKVATLFAADHASTLPARAPAEASLYAAFSGDASQLAALLDPSSNGHGKLALDLAEQGIELRDALALLAGDGAVAGYFDAAEFYRALAQTHVPMPRGELLAEVRVRDSAAARALAQRLLTDARQQPSTEEISGGVRLESTLAGHPAGAFVDADSLLVTWGLRRLDDVIHPGDSPRLQTQLASVLPADASSPGRLVLYVDLARILDDLERRQAIPGLSPEELVRARLMTRIATAPFAPLRDVSIEVAPTPLGLRASGRVRLR